MTDHTDIFYCEIFSLYKSSPPFFTMLCRYLLISSVGRSYDIGQFVLNSLAVNKSALSEYVNMEDGRLSSYSSYSLSSRTSSGSVSSRSSSATYASIKSSSLSINSYTSRISESLRSVDFWNQFDRNSVGKKRSVSKVMTVLFSKKPKREPSKINKSIETSLSEDLKTSTCPPGLYCVIDEFITEYDMRLLEEEKSAEIVAKRSTELQH